MHILIVDDEQAIASIIAETLDQEGHTTVTASNGFQTLQYLEEQHPDIIFLDLMMYPISGQEVLSRLTQQGSRSRYWIIVMSAGLNLPQEAERINADDFLEKPFDLDAIDLLLRKNEAIALTRPASGEMIARCI